MSMLSLPVVRLAPALLPNARLNDPVVLFWRAAPPTAMLSWPVVFKKSEMLPVALFLDPVVLLNSA